MSTGQVDLRAWSTVRLTNGDETVFVMLTDVDDRAYYGTALSLADNRVRFPKDEWSVVDE